jgi:hypothetical protein
MTSQNANSRQRPSMAVATRIGFLLWAVALGWWFFYYAQWQGAFALMRLKLMCIAGTSHECTFFQQMIGRTSWLPIYSPLVWWGGCLAFFIGAMSRHGGNKVGPGGVK